ncbi:serine/threonine-protein kinase [Nocardiopsis nanhaiensis]
MEAETHRMLGDRYQLLTEIGRGGMGRVWRAHDIQLNRTVAIKEILLSPGLDDDERARTADRARREAQATAMGQHPNIVTVHDIVEDDGRPWIVMELLSGTSLHALVADQGPRRPDQAASLGLDLISALETAHAQGITHRDVKPENVMVTETGRVVLTDFGIATIADNTGVTQTAGVVGSPAYLAPERLAMSPATPASDLWSLGATLYHTATGTSPFHRPGIPATLHAITTAEPEQTLPGPLGEAIQGLLAKNPDQRTSAEHCRELLTAAASGAAATPSAPTAHLPGGVPIPGPTSTTENVAEAPTTAYTLAQTGRATPHPATAPNPPFPPEATPYPPAGAAQAAERTGGLSWPLVVLTLGLASILVVAGLLVYSPWDSGPDTALIGSEDPGAGAAEEQDPAEETEEQDTAPGEAEGEPADGEAADSEPAEEDTDPSEPGMTWTRDAEGFAVLVPEGWTRRAEGSGVFYDAPDGTSYLQIDLAAHPTDDEYEHVQGQHEGAPSRMGGYDLVRIDDVTGQTGFHSAADWEFTWVQDGTDRHVLARNITVAPGAHYTVAWATDATDWADQGAWRTAALESFDPA